MPVQLSFRSDLLRRWREEQDMTQAEMAEALGLDPRAYRRWESGDVNAGARGFRWTSKRQRVVSSTCRLLGVAPDDLVQELTNSPLHCVPLSSACFVGREGELTELEDLLTRSTSVALEGLAGVGKTELALQLVTRLARDGHFPGGVFWLPADDPDLQATWATTLADALEIPEGPLPERARQAVRTLSQRRDPLLLVLDDVDEWTNDVHPSPLPTGSHVRLLVTSRRSDLGGSRFRHLSLDVLDGTDARELLGEVSGRDLIDEEGLPELLTWLGGHALALELAGAYLRAYPEVTARSYLDRLSDNPAIEDGVKTQSRAETTVTESLRATWDALDEGSREAWHLAACFEPEPVSPELSDTCGLDAEARRALRTFHVLDDAGRGWWRLHRLTREFGQRAGSEAARHRAGRVFVEGCRRHVESDDYDTSIRAYVSQRRHVDLARTLAESVGLDAAGRASFETAVGAARYRAGDLIAARRAHERALELSLADGAEPLVLAARRADLAIDLFDLGEPTEARELLELVVKTELDELGESHPSVASRRRDLAMVLRYLGELPAARELLELSLAVELAHLGEDSVAVAHGRSNLGVVLKDLNDLTGARALFEQALASDLKNLGEDDTSVAMDRMYLALTLRSLGELAEARDLLELALASNRARFGEHHPLVTSNRSSLARVHHELGELPRARELLEQALVSCLENLGEGHPSVATYRGNLALVLMELGEMTRSQVLLEQALSSNLENLGEDHPSVAILRFNLGQLLHATGELTEARTLVESALDADRERLDEQHPHLVERRRVLAGIARDEGRLDEARTLAESVLAAELASSEEMRLSLARAHDLVATLDVAEGRTSEALPHLEAVLGSELVNRLPGSPSLARMRARLGRLLMEHGDAERGGRMLAEAREVVERLPLASPHRTEVEALLHGLR
ncbi:MAG: tetratricopeptide repeat protein [Acidobacteriota bacterium]